MIIITTHINADFDALASVIAAKKLYPEGIIVFPGSIEKRVREFIETFKLTETYQLGTRIRDIELSKTDTMVVVDAGSSGRIGELKKFINKVKIILYDHHKGNELRIELLDIPNNEIIIEDVGATATIFTEIFQKKKIFLTPLEATALCLGIYEETGSLTFPSTTERDLLAVAYLLKRGANLNIISSFLKPFINREDLSLLNEFLESSRDIFINNIRIKICKAKTEEYPGEIAHLAHRIMEMDHIDAVILMLEMPGRVVIIARSSVTELDVSELLAPLGGGGHPSAASATIKDKELEELEAKLTEYLRAVIKPVKLAKDIMTTHVITIDPDATLKEAEKELTKYGINVLPVIKNGKFLGIISRETVEKALFHGFRLHKVIEFATIDPEVVSPDTPVSEVEKIMIEQNQRFMPVIKDGKLLGAITRTDILRTMYEGLMRSARIDHEPSAPRFKNMTNQLKEHFPPETFTILKLAGEIADSLGFNAYLVGGSVRDLLRGERNLDIDIVIEGDGIMFAKKVADALNARVKTHERFGTAKIILKDGSIIDIATARTEYYEAPATLPKVETSSIKKDLYRRDFTINTLAIKLNSSDFGTLIDFFGGQKDLKEKTIRVLHSLSFVEDPTRALRAIRFSERFGFRISKHTENLIKTAVKMNLFERLSSERLHEELSLLLNEVSPLRAIERLSEYNLLSVIHPSLKFSSELKSRLKSLEELLAWYTISGIKAEVKKERLILGVTIYGLSGQAIKKTIERISPNKRYMVQLEKDIYSAKEILQKIRNTAEIKDPVFLYELLHTLSLEAILLAIAVTEEPDTRRVLIRYLTELREIKPSLTGKDLLKMGIKPGPTFSKIFRDILYEKLRGRLKTIEEEKEFVRKLITSY